MFAIGDYVVKSTDGVCRVDDILHPNLEVANPNKLYYQLSPLDNNRSTLYVPTDKADIQGVRAVLNKEEALAVINKIPDINEKWIENDRDREAEYKKIIRSYNSEALIGMIKNLYRKKAERLNAGKKNTSMEERFLNNAENLLYSEMSFVTGKDKDEMVSLIKSSI